MMFNSGRTASLLLLGLLCTASAFAIESEVRRYRFSDCEKALAANEPARISFEPSNAPAYFEIPSGRIWSKEEAEKVRKILNSIKTSGWLAPWNYIRDGAPGRGKQLFMVDILVAPGEFDIFDDGESTLLGTSLLPGRGYPPEILVAPYARLLGEELARPLQSYLLQLREWVKKSVELVYGPQRMIWGQALRTEKGLRIAKGHAHGNHFVTSTHAELNRNSEFENGYSPPDDATVVFTTQWHKTPDTGDEPRLLILTTAMFPDLMPGGLAGLQARVARFMKVK